LRTSELDYPLPKALIARRPLPDRDGGRLMVLERTACHDYEMLDWPDLLPAGSLVVLNDTRVIKARLVGRRPETGGRVELLLLARECGVRAGETRHDDASEQHWEALARPCRRLAPGTMIEAGPLQATVLSRRADGLVSVSLTAEGGVARAIESSGKVPIPPYLGRDDDEQDVERYQTVFAREPGSVAAPTAGLHISERILNRLRERGIETATLTLHVGAGTFRPVTALDLGDHVMHPERLTVGMDLVRQLKSARARGAAVVAVGTTVVRALESAANPERPGEVRECAGETRLLIQPGYEFRVVDGILTNFHLPQSTLLALVAAFAGLERTQQAYREAIERKYRFYSYGDAMWIPGRLV
jgi:S-adenosylmethionine:tRNA ribosyltransferase-isomerase